MPKNPTKRSCLPYMEREPLDLGALTPNLRYKEILLHSRDLGSLFTII